MVKVLLRIDMINDFFPQVTLPNGEVYQGKLDADGAEQIVPEVNSISKLQDSRNPQGYYYDYIVDANDCHPAGHSSYREWPIHAQVGTIGAKPHPDLDRTRVYYTILKGTHVDEDSKSAFIGDDGKYKTELENLLDGICRHHDIDRSQMQIDVVGLVTAVCVGKTASDSAKLGFRTRVVLNACRNIEAIRPEEEVVREFIEKGIEVATTGDIYRELGVSLERAQEVSP